MTTTFLISSFTVLTLSYLIAWLSKSVHLRDGSIRDYLFGHNQIGLAACSNTGSILSPTLILCAILPGILGFGLVPIVGLYAGILAGYGLFCYLARRIVSGASQGSLSPQWETNTMLDLVDARSRRCVRLCQLFLYTVTLAMELRIFRFLLRATVVESTFQASLLVALILLLCATYTSLGGYVGVLRTDMFQLLVYSVAGGWLLWASRDACLSTLAGAWRFATIDASHLVFFAGSLLIATAYFMAWPDMWVRNVGTLRAESGPRLEAVRRGGWGLAAVLAPPVLLAIALLSDLGHPSRAIEFGTILRRLAAMFQRVLCRRNSPALAWWTCGAAVCIFVTTVDTWLIGMMQHLPIGGSTRHPRRTKMLPYVFAMIGFCASLGLTNENVYYAFSLFALLLLFANAMVLVNAAFAPPKPIRIGPYCLGYVITCFALTLCLMTHYGSGASETTRASLGSNVHCIVIWQAAWALVSMFMMPRLCARLRRE